MSSSQPIICVPKRTHRVFCRTAPKLGEFSSPKQYSRNSIPPVSYFRGAVFRPVGGARKQPIKQPTEMPTSTMALTGRFLSLMVPFPTLMGRFSDFVLMGRFASSKSAGKQPIKKRGIKRFLINSQFRI